MLKIAEIKTLFTHAGTFHADDVCVAAFMRMAVGNRLNIVRGYNLPKDAEARGILVADIGDGPFDHHASPREKRENGVAYAAFGKVVRAYGVESGLLADEAEYKLFDAGFIQELDLYDNEGPDRFGGRMQGFCQLIARLNPMWDEDQSLQSQMRGFMQGVKIAEVYIGRELHRVKSLTAANELVKAELANARRGVLVLDEYVPFQFALAKERNINWVIVPSQRGGYAAMSVKDRNGRSRQLWPECYRGKPRSELQALCKGMTFCHATGFMAVFQSKGQAQEAAEAMWHDRATCPQ